MASENVDNWDEPLPDSESEEMEEEEDEAFDVRRQRENLEKLKCYVDRMAYKPVQPKKGRKRSAELANARPRTILALEMYRKVTEPRARQTRWQRMTSKYAAITTEQLEQVIRINQNKDRKKEDLVKRKQEVYYDMLTKLERQCRNQYLTMLVRKFANFIAKLATTMHIPPQLLEPYARMQRGLFCNILMAVDVQPNSQAALYYNSPEAQEYEVCHKLAHALLSLVIKALDTASTRKPDDLPATNMDDFEMDNYIKDRIMCAAEKKVKARTKLCTGENPLRGICNNCNL